MELSKNPARKRYEAHTEGEFAGFAGYIEMSGLVIFSFIEVVPTFEGQGVGSGLARFALDDVRTEGSRKVQPLCPCIKSWIDRNPDYRDLER